MSPRSVRRFLWLPTAQVWVAVSRLPSPGLTGCLILLTRRNSGVARIYSLVVSPAARGQGLGERLVRTAEAAARAQGRRRISLEVREDNAAARRLYAKLGYLETLRLPHYYDDGADGLRLCKTINSP